MYACCKYHFAYHHHPRSHVAYHTMFFASLLPRMQFECMERSLDGFQRGSSGCVEFSSSVTLVTSAHGDVDSDHVDERSFTRVGLPGSPRFHWLVSRRHNRVSDRSRILATLAVEAQASYINHDVHVSDRTRQSYWPRITVYDSDARSKSE